jgi:hypothetical protein
MSEILETKTISITEKMIGNTLYIVESVVTESATETAYDKVKRLILNNLQSLDIPKVS